MRDRMKEGLVIWIRVEESKGLPREGVERTESSKWGLNEDISCYFSRTRALKTLIFRWIPWSWLNSPWMKLYDTCKSLLMLTWMIQSFSVILGELQEFGLTASYMSVGNGWVYIRTLGGSHVKPEIRKLEAVKNFPVLKTKRSLVIPVNCKILYRCSIKTNSIAVPLTNLNKNNKLTVHYLKTRCS